MSLSVEIIEGGGVTFVYTSGRRVTKWDVSRSDSSDDLIQTLADVIAVAMELDQKPIISPTPVVMPSLAAPPAPTLQPGKPKWDDDDLPLM